MEAGVSLPLVSVLPGVDIRLSVVSVPLTREQVYLVGSNLLEFRPAGFLVGPSHSADLLGLDVQKWVFFFIPSRSKVDRPDVVLPPLCKVLATTVLPALASSVPDVSSSLVLVIPKSWVPGEAVDGGFFQSRTRVAAFAGSVIPKKGLYQASVDDSRSIVPFTVGRTSSANGKYANVHVISPDPTESDIGDGRRAHMRL